MTYCKTLIPVWNSIKLYIVHSDSVTSKKWSCNFYVHESSVLRRCVHYSMFNVFHMLNIYDWTFISILEFYNFHFLYTDTIERFTRRFLLCSLQIKPDQTTGKPYFTDTQCKNYEYKVTSCLRLSPNIQWLRKIYWQIRKEMHP